MVTKGFYVRAPTFNIYHSNHIQHVVHICTGYVFAVSLSNASRAGITHPNNSWISYNVIKYVRTQVRAKVTDDRDGKFACKGGRRRAGNDCWRKNSDCVCAFGLAKRDADVKRQHLLSQITRNKLIKYTQAEDFFRTVTAQTEKGCSAREWKDFVSTPLEPPAIFHY